MELESDFVLSMAYVESRWFVCSYAVRQAAVVDCSQANLDGKYVEKDTYILF